MRGKLGAGRDTPGGGGIQSGPALARVPLVVTDVPCALGSDECPRSGVLRLVAPSDIVAGDAVLLIDRIDAERADRPFDGAIGEAA